MSNSDSAAAPSPWKSFRRALFGIGILFASCAALWAAWYGYAIYRVHTEIREINERQEPLDAENFQSPSVPDSENAYPLIVKAASGPFDRSTSSFYGNALNAPSPWSTSDIAIAKSIIDENAVALHDLDQAMRRPKCISSLVPATDEPQEQQRIAKLCNLIAYEARYDHERHQDDLALDDIRKSLFVADAMPKKTLGQLMLSSGMSDRAAQVTLLIASKLLPAEGEPSPSHFNGHLISVAEILADRNRTPSDFRQAILGDRSLFHQEIEAYESYTLFMRPLIQLNDYRFLHAPDEYLKHSQTTPWEIHRIEAWFPEYDYFPHNFADVCNPLWYGCGDFYRDLMFTFRDTTDLRAASIALAARAYQLEHDKPLPTTLAALMPRYLKRVPVDCFRKDGGPFTYDASRGVIWSFGQNGKDDGGIALPTSGGSRWRSDDAVYSLLSPDFPAATTP